MSLSAQTATKEHKAGHQFYVSLPEYMSKTTGLNSAAAIQFRNSVKDIAGFIIFDTKEELQIAEMTFSSINEFYENFIVDFLTSEKKRKVSEIESKSIGETNFVEVDASYYDKDLKTEIYYFVGIAETKNSFYKVLCFSSLASKDKFKADFQQILYSIKD